MKNTKIAPLYERLSRDDELQGDSNSIIHQKQMLEDYAVKNGFPNPLHFTDDGISGTRFDRPSFTAMMEEVEAGRVDTIIVKDMSRLGRDYLKVGQIMEILRQKGISLQDGSMYNGEFAILNGNYIDADTINDIAHFKNSPLVQKAVFAVIQAFPQATLIDRHENYLKAAEISTEQNYNQIDGIINNQPTVAQLEQDAKSGKPISLMDLLDATRREEKQSVMEQLKTKPPQTQEKSKKAPSVGAEMER